MAFPGFSNFDYDDIMRQYNDRMEMGEPEPIDSFLPDPRDLPPIGLNPPPGGFGEGPLYLPIEMLEQCLQKIISL